MEESDLLGTFLQNGQLDMDTIIEKYYASVLKTAKSKLSDPEDADEVCSNVFVILWLNYKKGLIGKETSVPSYLSGIVRNLVNKEYQRRYREGRTEPIDDLEIPDAFSLEQLAESKEKSRIIESAIDELSEEKRTIFLLFYYRGHSVKEIAAALHLSESNVKVSLHRARKEIRKKCKERGYHYGAL